MPHIDIMSRFGIRAVLSWYHPFVIWVVIACEVLLLSACSIAKATPPPNIILVLADDQGWNGTSVRMDPTNPGSASDFYQTPNLDQLAASGMRFSSAYSAAPVCTATRAALQTGLSPAQLQLVDLPGVPNPRGFGGLPLTPPQWKPIDTNLETLAERVKAANPQYVTGHIGKWHLDPTSETALGYDYFNRADRPPGVPGTVDPGAIFTKTSKAVEFINDRVAADQPFFLQISHFAVHNPIEARPEVEAKYQALPPGVRHSSAKYAAFTEDLDTGLGMIMDQVQQLGIQDNTYIMYYSDNGARQVDSLSTPLFRGKTWLFEGGIRVPLVIAGPGIAPNTHSSIPVGTTDLYATISDLAGNNSPFSPQVEGASIAPLLFNEGVLPDGIDYLSRHHGENGALYFHYPMNHGITSNGRVRPHSAIRYGDYKLMRFYGENGNPDELLLFDLAANITETSWLGSPLNLAGSMPEKTQELLGMLNTWLESADASLPYDVAKPVTIEWNAASSGLQTNAWRSVTNVQQYFRETWNISSAPSAPKVEQVEAFQPGLEDHAYQFGGMSGMTRMFFHVSNGGNRIANTKPSTGVADFDRSATFEMWVRLSDLENSHVLLESGLNTQGLSLTLGDADGDGANNDLRFRVLGKSGQSLTTTVAIDQFADPSSDFVHLAAVFNDANDDRYTELYVNGALYGRTQGLSGAENTLYWDGADLNGTDDAGLGASAGPLGGNSGAGPLPFSGNNLRGDVGHFIFHNHALTKSDVRYSFNKMLGSGNYGLTAKSGAINTVSLRPTELARDEFAADQAVLVMHERSDVLREELNVDLIPSANSVVAIDQNWNGIQDSIAPGTPIISYLVHFDPIANPSASGSITFAQPIVAVIFGDTTLAASDSTLGSIGRFPTTDRSILTDGSALLDFSSDLRTLELQLTSDSLDPVQLRIITLPILDGDFNGDGIVDIADYTVWRDTQGATGEGLLADANYDQKVDNEDYLIWKQNFGAVLDGAGGQVAVPEISALGMCSVIAVFVFLTHMSRRPSRRE